MFGRTSRLTQYLIKKVQNVAKSKRRAVTASQTSSKSTLSPLLIGGVVVAVIILVAGLILLGNQGSESQPGESLAQVDFSNFPSKGSEEAPVTFIDFSNYG
jgi:hypothetical protein